MGTHRCSVRTVLVYVSCVCRQFYLAVSAGRKQQQITEQLLMNHFIFTAVNHQLPHLLTQNTQKFLTENNRTHIILLFDVHKMSWEDFRRCVVKLTSCWSRTRSMSNALMCCFFPWSCIRKEDILESPFHWLSETDNRRPCCAFLTHPVFHGLLDKSEAFPAWVKLLLVSASEKHEVTDDLSSHRRTRQTDKGHCETFAGLPQGRIITFHTWVIEKSKRLDTLMMTKSDFVSSSECSKMWSGLGKSPKALIVRHSDIRNKVRSLGLEWSGVKVLT